jgi:hypothetical protein
MAAAAGRGAWASARRHGGESAATGAVEGEPAASKVEASALTRDGCGAAGGVSADEAGPPSWTPSVGADLVSAMPGRGASGRWVRPLALGMREGGASDLARRRGRCSRRAREA